MTTDKGDRAFALSYVESHLMLAKHWAIKAKLDQSVVSELDHLQVVVSANKEEAK